MALIAIVTMLALLEFVYFGARVGQARGKYDVQAPATSGNEQFDRVYRVHYNTLEQLVVFLPSLWVFAYFIHDLAAAGLGVLFLVGRMLYSIAYTKDPKTRTVGFLMGFAASTILLLGGLGGAMWRYFF